MCSSSIGIFTTCCFVVETQVDLYLCRFLRSIPSEKLLPLFKVEIRPALLGEIFSVLDECWERNELQSPAENPSSKESTTEALEGAMGSMTIEEPSATLRREGEANGDGSINDFETNTENLGAVPQRSEAPSGLPQLDGSYTNKECKGPLRTDAGADADPLARIASTGASETEVTQERTPSGSRVDAAENKPHVSSVASCEKQKNDLQGNEETADPQTGNSVEEILDVLTALSKSGRFGLTVRLLSGGHKKDMRSFFEKLRVATVRQGAADTLERLKGVEALFQV